MTRILPSFALLAVVLQTPAPWSYPPAKTGDASDTYFGKTYKDPYRWLENLKDNDVETWFKTQADLTDGLLAKIPARDALANEWMALDKLKPASYSQITYENGRVFYKKPLAAKTSASCITATGGKARNNSSSIRPASRRRARRLATSRRS
jgi:prolyl oligopeptidase